MGEAMGRWTLVVVLAGFSAMAADIVIGSSVFPMDIPLCGP